MGSDLNLVVVAGRLAAAPEVRVFEGGSTLVRYLVTIRTKEPRRRIDVVPIEAFDIDMPEGLKKGSRIWVAGSIQRRFWSDDHSRRNKITVVAHHVQKNIDQAALDELVETEDVG